ncbi:hypothetical protein AGLY_009182 [Aphis glycines]|uniref:CIDE-N domain-containing protein n=1 Tax=Aphis glycines TaxID=307491 RepID=A0A6G0TKR9_APHGL|nr:hypothetical protein AGLY_009182 [Aphis glycines]
MLKESRGKRPFKIWDGFRNIRKSLLASSLKDLEIRGKEKLNIAPNESVRLVLETDGTQIEDPEYFKTLPNNTTVLLLRNDEYWYPAEVDAIKTAIAAIPKIVCETIHALELQDETPSWKIMDNKGRVTVVLHWDHRSQTYRGSSNSGGMDTSPSKKTMSHQQNGVGGSLLMENNNNNNIGPLKREPNQVFQQQQQPVPNVYRHGSTPQITVIHHDAIPPSMHDVRTPQAYYSSLTSSSLISKPRVVSDRSAAALSAASAAGAPAVQAGQQFHGRGGHTRAHVRVRAIHTAAAVASPLGRRQRVVAVEQPVPRTAAGRRPPDAAAAADDAPVVRGRRRPPRVRVRLPLLRASRGGPPDRRAQQVGGHVPDPGVPPRAAAPLQQQPPSVGQPVSSSLSDGTRRASPKGHVRFLDAAGSPPMMPPPPLLPPSPPASPTRRQQPPSQPQPPLPPPLQHRSDSSDSETETTVIEDDSMTSEKFLLLIDQLVDKQDRHLTVKDIGIILERLNSKIVDVERLDRDYEATDCYNWTIKATIRGDVLQEYGIIYNGNYYGISEHPGYRQNDEELPNEDDEEALDDDDDGGADGTSAAPAGAAGGGGVGREDRAQHRRRADEEVNI